MIESLAERIRAEWDEYSRPRLPLISTSASLAQHGLLSFVVGMRLNFVDMSSVPAEHLASLASCVTTSLWIQNVSNTDLTSILDSSKCEELRIHKQSLSTGETRALVRAMANVEVVEMGYWGETLDISTLVTYGGRGKCKEIRLYNKTVVKQREEVWRWAQKISWRVTHDNSTGIIIERK